MSDEQFHRNQMEAHGRELQGIDHYLNSPEDDPAATGDGPGAVVSLVAELRAQIGGARRHTAAYSTGYNDGIEHAAELAAPYDAEITRLRERVAELEATIERWTSEAEDRDFDTDN